MISWLTGLFGSSKSTDTVVETAAKGIYNGLDALFFTDEEKAEFRQKQAETVIKFAEIAYDENSIRSVTRRWLAFMVVGPTMLFALAGAVIYIFNEPYANFLLEMAGKFIPWAGGILAFYFGGHLVAALPRKS